MITGVLSLVRFQAQFFTQNEYGEIQMIMNDTVEIIVKGNLFDNVEYTVFKTGKAKNYTFINISQDDKYTEGSIYDNELADLLSAITNKKYKEIQKISKKAYNCIKAFNNIKYCNNKIIEEICKILNITLSNKEKELYNQDFMDCKDDLYTFSKKTFNNNWFYCLQNVSYFDKSFTSNDIVKEIVQYYMQVFIECCIECQSDASSLY